MMSLYESRKTECKNIKDIPVEQKALIFTCVCNTAKQNEKVRNDIISYINDMPYILRKILIEKKKLIHDKKNVQEIYNFSQRLQEIYENLYARNSHLASVVYEYTVYNADDKEFIESLKNKDVMDTILKYEEEDQKFYGNVSEEEFLKILKLARRFADTLSDYKGFDPINKRFIYDNSFFDEFGFIKSKDKPDEIDDQAFAGYPYMDFAGFDKDKYNQNIYIEKIENVKKLSDDEINQLKQMKIWINPSLTGDNNIKSFPMFIPSGFSDLMKEINEYWYCLYAKEVIIDE